MSKKKETKAKDTVAENTEPQSTVHSLDNNSEVYEGFNPLDEPVKEREYTKPNIDADTIGGELEEPTFEAPSFEDFEDNAETDEEPSTFNPAVNDLDKKEKSIATEQMVDTVLDVYGKAHLLANKFTKIKEEKIADAIQEGEISPNLRIPIDENGNSLALMEYVEEYNQQLADAIKLEDDFVEKVRPPMIRVFQKKGLAMTDEQYLMVTFGSDILQKGALMFQLVKQNNKLIEMWKDQSGAYRQPSEKKQTRTKAKPSQEEVKEEPKPQPDIEKTDEPAYQEPEEFTAQSMVEDMMDGKENNNFEDNPQPDGMPQFGNPDMLAKLDELSKQEDDSEVIDVTPKKAPSKKRGRPKKSATKKRGRPKKNK